jgi:hypothetical protein
MNVEKFGPPQGAQLQYSDSSASLTAAWQRPNLLTVLGRQPQNAVGAQAAAANGAIVAVYLDSVYHNDWGKYEQMLFDDPPGSPCNSAGPAIPAWPGMTATMGDGSTEQTADIRVPYFGAKLLCVVRQIKADMPYVKAIFLDDYGPQWQAFVQIADTSTRDATMCQARKILGDAFQGLRDAQLGLLYFVNSVWDQQQACSIGGGYPDPSKHGLGGAIPVWEHHAIGQGPYATSIFEGTSGIPSQWLKDRSGEPGVFVITRNSDETNYWAAYPWVGFVDEQVTDPPTLPNFPGHSIGLTDGVRVGRSSSDGVSSAGQASDRLRARSFSLTSPATLFDGAIYLAATAARAACSRSSWRCTRTTAGCRARSSRLVRSSPWRPAAQRLGMCRRSRRPPCPRAGIGSPNLLVAPAA